jgi:methylase of polypeptide subunit release factors
MNRNLKMRLNSMNNILEPHLKRFYETHQHGPYITDFYKSFFGINSFFIGEKTLRPEESWAAKYMSVFLYDNRSIFKNKSILDVGCGTGIQGIIALYLGKGKSLLSLDISEYALDTTAINRILLKMQLDKFQIVKSNLFEKVKEKVDIILFNPPYINDKPLTDIEYIIKMPKEKFASFFEHYHRFLNPGGKVIMAYSYLVGEGNNPAAEAQKGLHSIIVLE